MEKNVIYDNNMLRPSFSRKLRKLCKLHVLASGNIVTDRDMLRYDLSKEYTIAQKIYNILFHYFMRICQVLCRALLLISRCARRRVREKQPRLCKQ